ncbi:MAG: hypothetical protein J5590_03515 [Clostridia bacterium]|nr:hypothetical protein [Clostridia bacterium]
MKKLILILSLCLALFFCLCACGNEELNSAKPNNDSVQSTDEPAQAETAVDSVPADDEDSADSWKQAYINYLESLTSNESYNIDAETFALIDLNDDGIPELYEDHGSTAGGAEVLTYFNGNLESQYMYTYGLHYIEGENLFRDMGGHMDGYYDEIYRIENGKFISVASGAYGAEDNTNVQFDENGKPIYEYYWEDTEVSEEEYEEMLNSVYDTSRETDPYSEELMYDYNEIYDVIENYIG